MKCRAVLFIFLTVISLQTMAQALFFKEAKIEFERRIHTWPILDENEYTQEVKKALPKYKVDYFTLIFSGGKSLYQPAIKPGTKTSFFDNFPSLSNKIFVDWEEDKIISQKTISGSTYLIEDSLGTTTWKLTNDFREIAGFNCRRATTMILDSVFVVAFYTDQLTMPGGPESMNGLPGTILGLVINKLHTSWYATKVETKVAEAIEPPFTGTKITSEGISRLLAEAFSNQGKEALFSRRSILF